MLILPETPRFLIKKGKHEQAAKALAKVRRLPVDHPGLVEELAEVRANHDYEMSVGKGSYLDCLKGTIGKRLITGCALQALQQLSGVNFIFYYGTAYFERAGFENPFIIQVITNTVNVVSTFPGLYLVEKMGRRNLLLMGAIGMTVAQFVVAITGTVAGTNDLAAQRTAIAFVCIYIFFFASSWGPVAWVVTGELFPLRVRAKCLSLTTATNWLLNFIIAYVTPILVDPDRAGLESRVFFIWGSCCALSIFFVFFMIYEVSKAWTWSNLILTAPQTKGLALEQVDELYATVTKAWKSKQFRPQINFREAEVEGDTKRQDLRQMSIAQSERRASRVNKEVEATAYHSK